MQTHSRWEPLAWAQQTFGAAALGDIRRTQRAVQTAARMLRCPSGSLPEQMGSRAATEGVYDLLAEADVSFAALSTPHWQQTRQAARARPLVLLIQDTTHADFSRFRATQHLSHIGDGYGRGYLLHTTLAVVPQPREVLGIAYQQPWFRQPPPLDETRPQRAARPRESQVWGQAVTAIGWPPEGRCWVEVGDCASDIFAFMTTCRQQQHACLVRVAQNRRIRPAEGEGEAPSPVTAAHVLDFARRLDPVATGRRLDLPARDQQPARTASLALAYGRLTLEPGWLDGKADPLPMWVIRVWEPQPPDEAQDAIEWVLLTSVPTETVSEGWERAEWYSCRWLVEDYHKCLKTGCDLQARRLSDGAKLLRLLGVLAPIAVYLLQLREWARLTPDRLAHEVLPADQLAVVAHLAQLSSARMTLGQFWRAVATQGGYQGRRSDGPPGWQTLWKGWHYIQTLLEGVRLAARLPPLDT